MKIIADDLQNSHSTIACFEKLAETALDIPMRYFRKNLHVEKKADSSPVTEADKATEKALRNVIITHHSDHGIIGEEMAPHKTESEYQWILDPIDGTKSFICGMPLFGVLIGLLYKGEPILGMMVMPALKQVFFGASFADLHGAWSHGEPIKTSDVRDLNCAYISLGEANRFCLKYPRAIEILSPEVDMLRTYHDCYSFALLASGGLHGVIETGLQAYDILPIVPLIKGAGGFISDWQAGALSLSSDFSVVATANENLHNEALKLLQRLT